MLLGRDAEMAAIDHLLDGARGGTSGVLVVRGEAGIGKSAILAYAGERATGMTVLRTTGVDAESELAYAALHQLLRPVFGTIVQLPEPQAEALRAAFALTDETVDQRFRVSLAVLGLLAEEAERQPLLCLVDDAQWLDQASADALLFAARRLLTERLAILFGARDDPQWPFPARGLDDMRLRPLGPADSRALVAARTGSVRPAEAVDWVLEHANGNPLALVELPDALGSAGPALPATAVEQAYSERIAGLSPAARELLLVAAVEETGDRATIARACDRLGLEGLALSEAESEGLIVVRSDRIEFRHPLVRSAVYRGAGFADRERCHGALAAALTGPGDEDRRAWHLAAATVLPDEQVAEALERTAGRAALRSGWTAAAAALARAADLTAEPDERGRRLVSAADGAWHGGRPERAAELLNQAEPMLDDDLLRARCTHIRGVIGWRCGDVPAAAAILIDGAGRVASRDPGRALEMLADGGLAAWDGGAFDLMARAGVTAAALPQLDHATDRLLRMVLVSAIELAHAEGVLDRPQLADALDQALAQEDPRVLVWAGIAAELAGETDRERALLARAVATARTSGAVDRLTVALESASIQWFLAGQFSEIAEALEGLRIADEAGFVNAAGLRNACLALLASMRGDEATCRDRVAEVAPVSRPHNHGIANAIAEWSLGLLDLGQGRYEDARMRLRALAAAPPGAGHPIYADLSTPDLVESCMRAAEPQAAAEAVVRMDAYERPGAPPWARPLAARCRAMLADGDEADVLYQRALDLHERTANGFETARTRLLYGEHLRRARRRSDARQQLRLAFEVFERVGAEPWALRAAGELRATGETARKRDPSTAEELTPQELQIARLVGEGLSNKEAAAQLFLSPRTIEFHLRNVFAKLGISSRSELIRRQAAEPVGTAS